jgi:hypothetical protein
LRLSKNCSLKDLLALSFADLIFERSVEVFGAVGLMRVRYF